MAGIPPRLVAYSDESHFNEGRFRAVALVSLRESDRENLTAVLKLHLSSSGMSEFKWTKLRSARGRFAALKFVQFAVENAMRGKLRLDVLVWDTEDRRHQIPGRDDIENLARMYYFAFKTLLTKRWPDGSFWRLYPDENSALHWGRIEGRLSRSEEVSEIRKDLLTQGRIKLVLKTEFRVEDITPVRSDLEPLVQLADLFGGLAVYSRRCYEGYVRWRRNTSPQAQMFCSDESSESLTGADAERCSVLKELDALCKANKLGVSLKTFRGLYTPNPTNPLNFWLYVAQHEQDFAPVKRAR